MSAAAPEASSSPDDEPVGSIAEEAFKLFTAMSSPASAGPHDHACSTSWCPICQVVGAVREHPEAVAAVTQSATALVLSLRNLVDIVRTPQEEQ